MLTATYAYPSLGIAWSRTYSLTTSLRCFRAQPRSLMSQNTNKLPPTYNKPLYKLIKDRLCQGRVIPFLGAGASLVKREANTNNYLPTATELARVLADKTEFPAENDRPLDLATVAQYYSVFGGRAPLHETLHSIFNRDYPLTSLHTFLASIEIPLLIITTNYDDLMERALDAASRPYDLVIYQTEVKRGDKLLWRKHGETEPKEVISNRVDIDLEKVTVIYKMHGAVDRHAEDRDHYVITEDDYIDFLTRMMKKKAIPTIFAAPFQKRHFLFLGYGLRDWNLRVVLNQIERDSQRAGNIVSWAIQHKPSLLEQRFWQKRGVEVYDQLLDEFVNEIMKR